MKTATFSHRAALRLAALIAVLAMTLASLASPLVVTHVASALTMPANGAVAKPASMTIQVPWAACTNVQVTQGYGTNFHVNTADPWHANDAYALDFGLAANSPVTAVAGGTVRFAGWTSGGWSTYGLSVLIDHGNGIQSFYAHLNRVDVAVNQQVSQRQQIGLSGGTGNYQTNYWDPHLHFAMYQGASFSGGPYGGRAVVPEPFSGSANYTDLHPGQMLSSACGSSPVTAMAALTSPANGSALAGSSVTFTRDNGSGVQAYFLGVGSSQGNGDFYWNWFGSNSMTVNGLPTDGRRIYVRLFSLINGDWLANDYSFVARSKTVVTPSNGAGAGSSGGTAAPARSEVVVDETSGSFSKGGSFWRDSSTGYGGHAYWTYVNGNATDCWGEWQANLAGGNYEVYVYVPRVNATSQQARYDVSYSGGTASRAVNQNAYYDAWVSLGTYNFSAGNARRVRLTDATGEPASSHRQLAFDAVKFVPR